METNDARARSDHDQQNDQQNDRQHEGLGDRSPAQDPALSDDDRVDEAGEESFPASDAPEGWAGRDVRPA